MPMGQTTISTWLISKPEKPQALETNTTEARGPSKAEHEDDSSKTKHQGCLPNPADAESSSGAANDKSDVPQPCSNLPKIPAQASIEACSRQHLKSFRRLTALLLPIPYPDSFYTETLDDPVVSSLTRLALWGEDPEWTQVTGDPTLNKQLVAAIRCRVMGGSSKQPSDDKPSLYISTLATLSPFREHGLASHLLQDVIRRAVEIHGVTAVMAHVWESNEEALAWYKKRGFNVVDKDLLYYRRLAPKTAAYVVKKDLKASDILRLKAESHGG